ncbi:MAG: TetR/AcrR family transcriptional regulator [Bacteroidota bacterium]
MSEVENPEQRILQAAKQIFYEKGFAGARMQEISEAAQVNKAMLHYYFRSKQQLFDRILKEALDLVIPRLMKHMGSDDPLEEKVKKIVAAYTELLTELPHLPLFILHVLQTDAHDFFQRMILGSNYEFQPALMKFLMQYQQEAAAGKVKSMDPRHILINLVSMSVFPFMMKSFLVEILGLSENDFEEFVGQRRDIVPQFLMDGLRP